MNINLFLEYQGLFYSKVDEQVESEEGERLRQFEERMFQNVKNQIEKDEQVKLPIRPPNLLEYLITRGRALNLGEI